MNKTDVPTNATPAVDVRESFRVARNMAAKAYVYVQVVKFNGLSAQPLEEYVSAVHAIYDKTKKRNPTAALEIMAMTSEKVLRNVAQHYHRTQVKKLVALMVDLILERHPQNNPNSSFDPVFTDTAEKLRSTLYREISDPRIILHFTEAAGIVQAYHVDKLTETRPDSQSAEFRDWQMNVDRIIRNLHAQGLWKTSASPAIKQEPPASSAVIVTNDQFEARRIERRRYLPSGKFIKN